MQADSVWVQPDCSPLGQAGMGPPFSKARHAAVHGRLEAKEAGLLQAVQLLSQQ